MTACTFPDCLRPAEDKNRRGQDTCHGHVTVVTGDSWADDRHSEGGHG